MSKAQLIKQNENIKIGLVDVSKEFYIRNYKLSFNRLLWICFNPPVQGQLGLSAREGKPVLPVWPLSADNTAAQ